MSVPMDFTLAEVRRVAFGGVAFTVLGDSCSDSRDRMHKSSRQECVAVIL